jgi:hypothetical protein
MDGPSYSFGPVFAQIGYSLSTLIKNEKIGIPMMSHLVTLKSRFI